jgi:hypothetical protein
MDEARREAATVLGQVLIQHAAIERAVLLDDLLGRLRVIVWCPRDQWGDVRRLIESALAAEEVGGRYWSGEVWNATLAGETDRLVYEKAWEAGRAVEGVPQLRLTDRHRNRGGWFKVSEDPPWVTSGDGPSQGPPIVVFYSFKGGVGRSTALGSFAIQRARAGERVAVIDFDLDAPGIGSLLASDEAGTTADWGVVDYLLERPYGDVDLRDYYHACRREEVTGAGEILVVPAGRLDADYLGKLARIDLEPAPPDLGGHRLISLFHNLRKELEPHWLLIDARAGLSELAGVLLGGVAHLHVVFGTHSDQSWAGLRLVLRRLGADRVLAGRPQAECLLVQAMVPEDPGVAESLRARFADQARSEFTERYYAEAPEDPEEDRFWDVRDLDAQDAPHAPVSLSYSVRLAQFRRIDEVAPFLADAAEYRALAERITSRFVVAQE